MKIKISEKSNKLLFIICLYKTEYKMDFLNLKCDI